MNKIRIRKWRSPVGSLTLGEIDGHICLCDWVVPNRQGALSRLSKKLGSGYEEADTPTLDKLEFELEEYFSGRLKAFDMPLRMVGTEFQRKVWEALRGIPYGDVISYAELARRIGNPAAVRAVARANSQNPISILVPCHRVIGADGSLTGYAGGMAAKRGLLALEDALPAMPLA